MMRDKKSSRRFFGQKVFWLTFGMCGKKLLLYKYICWMWIHFRDNKWRNECRPPLSLPSHERTCEKNRYTLNTKSHA